MLVLLGHIQKDNPVLRAPKLPACTRWRQHRWWVAERLGAKLASPDRPVVCISGDGSAMWSIQSLWNASHYNIPVTFIIISNACYRQVRMMKMRIMGECVKGRDLGTVLSPPEVDFCKIAEGFGIAAQKVTDPGELAAVLKNALGSGAPNLIDVVVDPSF